MADSPTPPVQEHYPPFVETDEDRRRWDLAVAVAPKLLGEDASQGELWTLERHLYHSEIPTDSPA